MGNFKVKLALVKIQIAAKQAASDLGITQNRFSRIVNGHECPNKLVEKIGRYLRLKPEHVNKNYKQRGTKNKGKMLLIRGKKVNVLSEKKR